MISKDVGFARYSRTLCWVVAVIWLVMAILSFTGDDSNAVINGFLWLVGGIAFAVSAAYIGRNAAASGALEETETADDQGA